jgi:DNA-binding CsgD family transcriptional regulator
MAANGNSNRSIGDQLGVSARAVEHHLTKIYRKLGIDGRADLNRALLHYREQPGFLSRAEPVTRRIALM